MRYIPIRMKTKICFQFYKFLKDGDMPLDSIYSWINDQLHWGNYTPPVRITGAEDFKRQESGLKALWNDLTSLIPTEELLAWYLEMLAVNPDMRVMNGSDIISLKCNQCHLTSRWLKGWSKRQRRPSGINYTLVRSIYFTGTEFLSIT